MPVARKLGGGEAEAGRLEAARLLEDAKRDADAMHKASEIEVRERMLTLRAEVESELKDRRVEIAKAEERVTAREAQAVVKESEIVRREQGVDDREAHARQLQEELKVAREEEQQVLERTAGMTAVQARDVLLRRTEEQARHDMARMIRQIEEEAKHEADRRVRNIISIGIQRTAASHAAETTVSMVELPSDDMKGRIIGREGRNIRALENLTGVDVIIDDTPAGGDPVGLRRRPARGRPALRLEARGRRPDPPRTHRGGRTTRPRPRSRRRSSRQASRRSFEANVPGLHPDLIKLLGRLRYRTSYGQNVLRHSLECTHLAAIMAAELGASVKTTRRAALLHDIGKAVTHEVEGSHAVIGAQFARKHRESSAVVHAIEAHHYDVEPQTVEAVLVQAADAISAARPGARGESMEHYVKRLEALERIATQKKGVDRCYAMQAGREVRVMVKPGEIDDDEATLARARDRARGRGEPRVPRPDQDHGDSRVARDGVRAMSLPDVHAFSSHLPVRISFGDDVIDELPAVLSDAGAKSVLVVIEEPVAALAGVVRALAACEAAGVRFERYLKGPGEPSLAAVDEAAAAGAGADAVVGIGGGSALDLAKAARVVLQQGGPVARFLAGATPLEPQRTPLVLIPTTSGTGSEVSGASVLTDKATGRKGVVAGPLMRATHALVDPLLTAGLPPGPDRTDRHRCARPGDRRRHRAQRQPAVRGDRARGCASPLDGRAARRRGRERPRCSPRAGAREPARRARDEPLGLLGRPFARAGHR